MMLPESLVLEVQVEGEGKRTIGTQCSLELELKGMMATTSRRVCQALVSVVFILSVLNNNTHPV